MKRLIQNLASFYSSGFSKNIIMLGAPGVGKGSYASRTRDELNIPHLVVGDIVRAEISSGSDLGTEFKKFTETGELIPDEIIITMVKNQLNDILEAKSGCLLDGIPRTLGQVEKMVEMGLHIGGPENQFFAVNLVQEEDVIIQKIVNRRICSECGDSYNFAIIEVEGYDFPPLVPEVEGVCDTCGSVDSLVQRNDDKEDIVRNRLEVYYEQTAPIIEVFEELGIIREFVINGGTKALMPSFIDFLKEF